VYGRCGGNHDGQSRWNGELCWLQGWVIRYLRSWQRPRPCRVRVSSGDGDKMNCAKGKRWVRQFIRGVAALMWPPFLPNTPTNLHCCRSAGVVRYQIGTSKLLGFGARCDCFEVLWRPQCLVEGNNKALNSRSERDVSVTCHLSHALACFVADAMISNLCMQRPHIDWARICEALLLCKRPGISTGYLGA
jgi:hypothetical protein